MARQQGPKGRPSDSFASAKLLAMQLAECLLAGCRSRVGEAEGHLTEVRLARSRNATVSRDVGGGDAKTVRQDGRTPAFLRGVLAKLRDLKT